MVLRARRMIWPKQHATPSSQQQPAADPFAHQTPHFRHPEQLNFSAVSQDPDWNLS